MCLTTFTPIECFHIVKSWTLPRHTKMAMMTFVFAHITICVLIVWHFDLPEYHRFCPYFGRSTSVSVTSAKRISIPSPVVSFFYPATRTVRFSLGYFLPISRFHTPYFPLLCIRSQVKNTLPTLSNIYTLTITFHTALVCCDDLSFVIIDLQYQRGILPQCICACCLSHNKSVIGLTTLL